MEVKQKMTDSHKNSWLQIRTRVKKALKDEKSIGKRDLDITFKLHKHIYGKPNVRPSINCCIDIATWLEMIKNINKAYMNRTGSAEK